MLTLRARELGLLRYEQMSRTDKSRVDGDKARAGIVKEASVENGPRGNSLLNVAPLHPKGRPIIESPLRRVLKPSKDLKAASSEQEISSESLSEHARATFGSVEKAQHWMNRPNPLFQGQTPLQAMRTDPVSVEAELVRIDHGVYV